MKQQVDVLIVGGSPAGRVVVHALHAANTGLSVTLEDLLMHQYATHPELAAKPSDNALVFAARDALSKIQDKPKSGDRPVHLHLIKG